MTPYSTPSTSTHAPVELGLLDGTLVLRTDLAGADVSVVGRYCGRISLMLVLSFGVSHEVMVSCAGYELVVRSVSVVSGECVSLSLVL
jgi:PEGA domain.